MKLWGRCTTYFESQHQKNKLSEGPMAENKPREEIRFCFLFLKSCHQFPVQRELTLNTKCVQAVKCNAFV